MKDKASVLLELEKVTTMKEDLTEEVGKLHKLLEQERSKANANNGDKNKEKVRIITIILHAIRCLSFLSVSIL